MRWLIMLVMCWENNKGYFEKNSEESNRFSDWIFPPVDFFFIGEKSIIYLKSYINNQRPILFFFDWVYRLSKTQNKLRKAQNLFYFFWEIGMNYAWQINSDFFWVWLKIYKIILIFSDCFCFSLIYLFFWYGIRNAHKPH